MTISPLDSDLFFRANDFMTSAATTTQYLKEMNPAHAHAHHGGTSSSGGNANASASAGGGHGHGHGHSQGPTPEAHDLELNFLSEFLLTEDFASDNAGTPLGGHHHGGTHAHAPHQFPQEMKVEAMAVSTDGIGYAHRMQHSTQHLQQQHAQHQQQMQQQPPAYSSSSDADQAEPVDRKAKRRQQVAISARRHRSRKKHELMDLRKEVSYMTSQLEFLRSKHKMMRPNGAVAEWEEKAMAQRRKRRQAEGQHEELRRAIYLQTQFLANLKSVFSNSPMFTDDLNLRQLLHTYTRLGRNPRSRQRDYESICAESKLQMATDILRRQTDSIRFSQPYIRTQLIDATDVFGATITSVYAFDTLDVARTFRACCAAIKGSSNTWPEFASLGGQHKVVDVLSKSNIIYGKQTTRYKTDATVTADAPDGPDAGVKAAAATDKEIVVETRVISFWKVTETEAVLVWDYVDDDDLHPVRADTDVKREMLGACLVRRELCEDGKERVVCRSICSKTHTRPPPSVAPQASAQELIPKFSTAPTRDLTRMCGAVVFDSIQSAMAGLSL